MKKLPHSLFPLVKNFFFIRILPHSGTQMTQRYAHLSDKALKEASAIVSSAVEKGSKKT